MSGDVLVQDARIIDGTGAPWYRADVRIRDGRIAAIEPGLDPSGATLVPAGDRFLAPGFIDAHCHDDLITLREPARIEKLLQGVTTVVVGNCSFSLYPTRGGSGDLLRQHFGALLGETAPTEIFSDFAGYRAALQGQGAALNLVSLVGHGPLRLAVMGYQGRAATTAERRAMCDLLAVQLRQGAAGLSLGLVYPPSAFADTDELVALARTVRDHGKLLTAHLRSYEGGLLTAVDEFLAILAESGAAGLLSHLQSAGRPYWGRVPTVLSRLEAARGDGLDVTFDMYPYLAGSSYLLQLLPPAALDGGYDALCDRLRDPAQREAIRRWIEEGSGDPHQSSKISLIGWDSVQLSAIGAAGLKHLEGRRFDAAAASLGITAFDLLVLLVEQDAGQTGVVLFQLDVADVRAACCHRLHIGGSDGLPRPGTRPHPRGYGSFPRFVGRLVRDEGWFPIEDAVRRLTSASAQRFGLVDRGVIRVGLAADLVLFAPTIIDEATFDAPTRLARGVSHVWVNGEAVVRDGQVTDRRPGRVLPLGDP
ncbi:MAG: D-aminoacylase [Azospirillaceae bacterium]|nr:D-aminoacylase [Azospirillaceae bacterium]